MRNKYSINFRSKGTDQEFTLTFHLQGGRMIHLVRDVQVYDIQWDQYAEISQIGQGDFSWRYKVETIHSQLTFHLEIHVNADGCNVYINEPIIATVLSKENLQPYN